MAKYRKRPIAVDAWQWNGTTENEANEFMSSFNCVWRFQAETDEVISGIRVNISGGWFLILEGDYIVRELGKGYRVCKPDIFEQTYEKVE